MTEEPWTHTTRCLDTFVIIFGIKGELYIHQDGVEHVIGPGTAAVLFPHHTHGGYKTCEPGLSFFWCHFLCQDDFDIQSTPMSVWNWHTAHAHSDEPSNRLANFIILPEIFHPRSPERVHVVFHQLLDVANAHYYTAQATNYWLTCLLIEISQQYLVQQKPIRPNRRFNIMLEWIRMHADRPITVTELAERFHYNRDYLSRLFKRELGIGPVEYIHVVKIARAKKLLCETDKTIKEIAAELGMNDEKYFMKLFKLHEHITPTEFRQSFYRSHLNKR
ncbi:hypothetical protein GCM10010885_11290 [Alicyclobacillus cellulosilyticus]|uniref:HTH araC/xylS-type domain-containing protein n=2 Tax=Alicyclobacillus cellulosilyticus TaxID=1003997 RepID=A0A917K9M3_9BACL|nr:hypothetical protein GCM10010885_11290 [Alicyclobacillus cellulosilyticus]